MVENGDNRSLEGQCPALCTLLHYIQHSTWQTFEHPCHASLQLVKNRNIKPLPPCFPHRPFSSSAQLVVHRRVRSRWLLVVIPTQSVGPRSLSFPVGKYAMKGSAPLTSDGASYQSLKSTGKALSNAAAVQIIAGTEGRYISLPLHQLSPLAVHYGYVFRLPTEETPPQACSNPFCFLRLLIISITSPPPHTHAPTAVPAE
ncbi:hypothetical protein, unlikely [Trypanosoma brucei gambiense DAL972]|uniref:Uncharacterized protein n=1 Tax=Trypanosoma brucei gambiense (strain MHOM/CI/86/DAL972) TaxID=679716 RepID=C9ZS23_TRYB9|nr:hypothetical protein, unlikely [Trypanosoma brucei gambiense DAL972]CBH12159.1 hypothetical protein, unlikely [Trypanosoma brucei gambiense DAL972]|eukprot:XP_011774442.1 hypothetical protein, unlikely [Trypanosoma brucei gambiense DAL972]